MDQWQLYTTNGFGFLGKPTTEFMGWRRLTPNELLNLDVGSFSCCLFLPICVLIR
jgi:hypothetical protein